MIIDFPGLGKRTFWGTRYEPSVFPFKNSLIPFSKRRAVCPKCELRPLENEKPNGRPVAPIFALSADNNFFNPPGCVLKKAVASTTYPSITAQNSLLLFVLLCSLISFGVIDRALFP